MSAADEDEDDGGLEIVFDDEKLKAPPKHSWEKMVSNAGGSSFVPRQGAGQKVAASFFGVSGSEAEKELRRHVSAVNDGRARM